jgi:hypothetical protein
MGPEVLVIFVAAMIAPLALACLIAFWWFTASSRRGLEVLWKGYAERRRRTFIPPTGEWPNRTPPAVGWWDEDVEYSIEARGDETLYATEVAARPTVAVCGAFVLRPQLGGGGAPVGDVLIDSRFAVESRPAGLAKEILTEDIVRALVGFDVGRAGSLRYDRGGVRLVWPGAEQSDARLDEACSVVRKVVGALERRARPARAATVRSGEALSSSSEAFAPE